MKVFVVLTAFVACACAAPQYGAPAIRVSSYDAPAIRMSSYEAPAIRMSSYEAAPIVEVKKAPVPIVKLLVDNDNYGTYSVDAISGDGSTQSEKASLKQLPEDLEGPVSVSSGSYSFIGDDGKTYKVDWTADENGFVAKGDHLPTTPATPPMPAELVKAYAEAALAESSYAAPATRLVSSYAAPAPVMPAVRIESSYGMPAIRSHY